MSGGEFIDTNVIVYADDASEPAKQAKAADLFARLRRTRRGVVSIQVLQEYYNAATRKLGVAPAIARQRVVLLSRLEVIAPDVGDVLAAIDLHRVHQISFWDALIIRTAQRAGCSVIHSEDLQPDRDFDGLRVVNPFGSPTGAP